jgi:hypothetical protein
VTADAPAHVTNSSTIHHSRPTKTVPDPPSPL